MMDTFAGTDRRVSKRLRMNCTVVYRSNEPSSTTVTLGDRDLHAQMLDISQSGMALITDYNIPTQTVLSMRVTLLKVDKEVVNFSGPLEITGEVRSNTVTEANEHRLGVYFTKMRRININ